MEAFQFLSTNDFEYESQHLMASIYGIPKPNFVEGFIYHFFDDSTGDPDIKKQIIFDSDDGFIRVARNPMLFDNETKVITLSSKEAQFINESYFRTKLKVKFGSLFSDLDLFHRHFKESKKFALIELYNNILDFLKMEEGAYSEGKIHNFKWLNTTNFKDEVYSEVNRYIAAVNEKLSILNSSQLANESHTGFPSEIFVNKDAYEKFKQYEIAPKEDKYTEFSFLLQMLLNRKLVHRISHKEFANWLRAQDFINDDELQDILIKGSFKSLQKSSSKYRIEKFNHIF